MEPIQIARIGLIVQTSACLTSLDPNITLSDGEEYWNWREENRGT